MDRTPAKYEIRAQDGVFKAIPLPMSASSQ